MTMVEALRAGEAWLPPPLMSPGVLRTPPPDTSLRGLPAATGLPASWLGHSESLGNGKADEREAERAAETKQLKELGCSKGER